MGYVGTVILPIKDEYREGDKIEMERGLQTLIWSCITMDDGYIFQLTFLAHVNLLHTRPLLSPLLLVNDVV